MWRALIQEAYLYVRNVCLVIIVHGDCLDDGVSKFGSYFIHL